MSGLLYKRIGTDYQMSMPSWVSGLKKRASVAFVEAAVTSAWKPRFFALAEGMLSYWREEEDRRLGKPPAVEIDLAGYEVLVDAEDPFWGFELRPTIDDGRRTWYFRAQTEDERIEWAQKLLANTLLSHSSDERNPRRSILAH